MLIFISYILQLYYTAESNASAFHPAFSLVTCQNIQFFLLWELFWFLVVCIHLLHMARNESIFLALEFCRVKIRSVLSPVSLIWAQFGAGTIEPWADFHIHLVRFQLFELACVSASGVAWNLRAHHQHTLFTKSIVKSRCWGKRKQSWIC